MSDSVKCGDNNKICEHLKVMGNIKVDESAKNQSVNVVNSDKDNTGRAIKTAMDIHNVTTSRRQTPRMQNNPEIEIKNDAERNKVRGIFLFIKLNHVFIAWREKNWIGLYTLPS